eukprot:353380_1
MSRSPREWAQTCFRPCVMVNYTQAVEDATQQSHMNLVELLSTFEGLPTVGSLSFRSSSERSHSLQRFGVRFTHIHAVHAPEHAPFEQRLERAMARRSSDWEEMGRAAEEGVDCVRDADDVGEFFRKYPDPTPWYNEYRSKFLDSLRFDPREFIDQPLGLVVAVSVSDEAPIERLKALSHPKSFPSLFKSGIYDSNVYKCFVLVHDARSGDTERAKHIFHEMKQNFLGDACKLLQINSAPEPQSNAPHIEQWRTQSSESPRFGPGNHHQSDHAVIRGCWMAKSDVSGLASFVSEFVIKGLLPHVEQRIRYLNSQITSERKGIRNQFRLFFNRKPKAIPSVTDGPMYDLITIESKIRQLAGLAFVMQDYRLAREHFTLVMNDYSTDKALAHLAGAQEMAAVCLLLIDGTRREIENRFEQAKKLYQQLGDIRRQTRAAMWALDAVRHWSGAMYNSESLVRINDKENPLRTALLREQTAYAYLVSSPTGAPPMVRKYAFNLIMAGQMFQQCTQPRHALRVYYLALAVIKDRGWSSAEEHLHFALGRQCISLGLGPEAVGHFMKLMNSGRAGKESQSQFLQEFRHAVSLSSQDDSFVPDLSLPRFRPVRAVLADRHAVEPARAKRVWAEAISNRNTFLFDPKSVDDTTGDLIAVQGEPIFFEVEVTNPLKLSVHVDQISLECSYIDEQSLSVDSNGTSIPSCSPDPFIRHETTSITLPPSSSRKLSLCVHPLRTGQLRVSHIKWRVLECAYGRLPLPESSEKGGLSPVTVAPPQPKLECVLVNFPKQLYHGEVTKCSMELHNAGAVAISRIQLKLSHPTFILLHKELLEDQSDTGSHQPFTMDPDGVLNLDIESLSPSEFISFPVWVRGVEEGERTLEMLFRYESQPPHPEIPFRLLHAPLQLKVHALMRVSWQAARASFTQLCAPLLAVQVNCAPVLAHLDSLDYAETYAQVAAPVPSTATRLGVEITHIHALGRNWGICGVGPSVSGPVRLHGKESATFFARLETITSSSVDLDIQFPYSSFLSGYPQTKKVRKRTKFGDTLSIPKKKPPDPDSLSLILVWNFFGGVKRPHGTQDVSRSSPNVSRASSHGDVDIDPLSQLPNGLSPLDHHRQGLIQSDEGQAVRFVHRADTRASDYPLMSAHGRCGFLKVEKVMAVSTAATTSCPLRLSIKHPDIVKANFGEERVLQVPVEIAVLNCSPKTDVLFHFETLSPNEQFDSHTRSFQTRETPSLSSRYFWRGTTHKLVGPLVPGAVEYITLSACFTDSGMFNLNRFRFLLNMPGRQQPRVFFFPLQHLIKVEDDSMPEQRISFDNEILSPMRLAQPRSITEAKSPVHNVVDDIILSDQNSPSKNSIESLDQVSFSEPTTPLTELQSGSLIDRESSGFQTLIKNQDSGLQALVRDHESDLQDQLRHPEFDSQVDWSQFNPESTHSDFANIEYSSPSRPDQELNIPETTNLESDLIESVNLESIDPEFSDQQLFNPESTNSPPSTQQMFSNPEAEDSELQQVSDRDAESLPSSPQQSNQSAENIRPSESHDK